VVVVVVVVVVGTVVSLKPRELVFHHYYYYYYYYFYYNRKKQFEKRLEHNIQYTQSVLEQSNIAMMHHAEIMPALFIFLQTRESWKSYSFGFKFIKKTASYSTCILIIEEYYLLYNIIIIIWFL
jgi:hypothetical protein